MTFYIAQNRVKNLTKDPFVTSAFITNMFFNYGASNKKHDFLDGNVDPLPISGAFVWGKTPQGHLYWSKLHAYERGLITDTFSKLTPSNFDLTNFTGLMGLSITLLTYSSLKNELPAL